MNRTCVALLAVALATAAILGVVLAMDEREPAGQPAETERLATAMERLAAALERLEVPQPLEARCGPTPPGRRR